MLQDIVREMLVAHQVADQPQEEGAVAVDQHFERALIAVVRLLNQDVIGQVRVVLVWREMRLHTVPLFSQAQLSACWLVSTNQSHLSMPRPISVKMAAVSASCRSVACSLA